MAKVFQPKLSSSTGTVNRTKSAQKVPKKAKPKLNNGRVFLTQNASIEYETDSSDSKEDHENNQDEASNDNSKEIVQRNKKIEKNDSLPFMDDDEEDYQDLYKHLTYETKASLTSIRTFTSVSGDDGPDHDPNPDPSLLSPSTSGLYRNQSTKTKASLTSIKVSSVDGPDPDPNPDPTLVSPSTTSGLYRNRSLSFDLNLPTPPTSFSYPGPFLKASTTLAESTLQTSNQNKRIMNLKTLEESSATCSPICIGSNPLTYPSKTLKSNQDIVSPNILSPTSAQRFQKSETRRK